MWRPCQGLARPPWALMGRVCVAWAAVAWVGVTASCGDGSGAAGGTSFPGAWGADATGDAGGTGGGRGATPGGPGEGGGADPGAGSGSEAVLCSSDGDCPSESPRCGLPGLCGECAGDQHCSGWERCVEGLCLGRLCEAGRSSCHGGWATTCGADGASWQVLPCAGGACDEGGCASCAPEQRACEAGQRVVCDAGGHWVQAQPCAAPTTCHRGECVACSVEGDGACAGTVAGICGPDGSLTETEDCSEDELWCEAAGEAVLAADCAAEGLMCFEGTCEAACETDDLKDGGCLGDICCRSADGAALIMSAPECDALGWAPTAHGVCLDGVCCKPPLGEPALTTPAACAVKAGLVLPSASCAPRLVAAPAALQFGPTVALCAPDEREVRLHNVGSASLILTSWELEECALDAFSLAAPTGAATPWVLAPGESIGLTVTYDPAALGWKTCRLLVRSTDPETPNTRVAISGTSEPELQVSEVFVADGQVLADVLFVVDTSGSMADNLTNLAANIGAFTELAGAWSASFRLGVTTTDVAAHAGALQGSPRFLTNDDWAGFAAHVPIDSGGSGDERGLEAAAAALSAVALVDTGVACSAGTECGSGLGCVDGGCGGPNRGFLRAGAWLDLVFVSDEDDHSPGAVDLYGSMIAATKGTTAAGTAGKGRVHAHAIVPPEGGCGTDAEAGTRYIQLAEATGGVVREICAPDWAADLATLAGAVFDKPLAVFTLGAPADPTTLQVRVGGAGCPMAGGTRAEGDGGEVNWTYAPEWQAVVFEAGASCAPAAGDEVQIDYWRQCP